MSDKEKKRLVIIGGIVLLVVIIWLLMKGPNGNTVVRNGGQVSGPGAVNIPGFDFGERRPFVVPDFAPNPNDFTMIGACCADCSGKSQLRTSYRPQRPTISFVTNEGNKGPVIHNYAAPETNSGGRYYYGTFGVLRKVKEFPGY